jgi:hypothetical protein
MPVVFLLLLVTTGEVLSAITPTVIPLVHLILMFWRDLQLVHVSASRRSSAASPTLWEMGFAILSATLHNSNGTEVTAVLFQAHQVQALERISLAVIQTML